MLAAVGVAFLLAVALNRALRQRRLVRTSRPEPDLLSSLDLVALGTVCDVVPLDRAQPRAGGAGAEGDAGARQCRDWRRLSDVAGWPSGSTPITPASSWGRASMPAGGSGESDLGVRLLGDRRSGRGARALPPSSTRLNAERREIEARVLAQAIAQAERGDGRAPLVFVAGEDWHPGVIGIVASRLKERYNRPAWWSSMADGVAKGSGRSVPGMALGPAVIAARQAGLLINGGGHAMAAGFTVEAAKLDAFRDFLAARIKPRRWAMWSRCPELGIDGALIGQRRHARTWPESWNSLAPFGTGNSRAAFRASQSAHPARRCRGRKPSALILGEGAGTARLKGIAFRALESPLGPSLLKAQGQGFHIAGHLRANNWQGREEVQLVIDDAAPALS